MSKTNQLHVVRERPILTPPFPVLCNCCDLFFVFFFLCTQKCLCFGLLPVKLMSKKSKTFWYFGERRSCSLHCLSWIRSLTKTTTMQCTYNQIHRFWERPWCKNSFAEVSIFLPIRERRTSSFEISRPAISPISV